MFIYILCDPDTDEVRYVGKTTDLKTRLQRHLQASELRPETHRVHWLRSLVAAGKKPVMKVIEEVTRETWAERECYWIEFYRAAGANLTNTADGGNGGKTCEPEQLIAALHKRSHDMAWRARLSDANRRRWQNPDYRAKMIAKLTGHTVSDEAKARIGKAAQERGTSHLLAPDVHARAIATTTAKRTKAERSASARKGWAKKTPEERQAIIRKGIANRPG
ncbi:MAG TPA: GIY-YIG nuclease family protein [Ktedonobacteraceae bacterium]